MRNLFRLSINTAAEMYAALSRGAGSGLCAIEDKRSLGLHERAHDMEDRPCPQARRFDRIGKTLESYDSQIGDEVLQMGKRSAEATELPRN
jgi:hypothetical protein